MSAIKQELSEENYAIFDMIMPIRAYWGAKDLLVQADYLSAHGAEVVELQDVFKKVFRHLAPYAVFEKDRLWLIKHSKSF